MFESAPQHSRGRVASRSTVCTLLEVSVSTYVLVFISCIVRIASSAKRGSLYCFEGVVHEKTMSCHKNVEKTEKTNVMSKYVMSKKNVMSNFKNVIKNNVKKLCHVK